jgi:hypothetical protein
MAIVDGEHAFDPCFMTVANLARLGADQFAAVMEWVESQRERERVRLAAHEERLEKFRSEQQEQIAAVHARQIAWAKKNL